MIKIAHIGKKESTDQKDKTTFNFLEQIPGLVDQVIETVQ